MYDRNVEFPQRYRLQKVDGTDDIFDLIPTPGEIRNEGTLINKSSLLKDATAALFGLGSDAVPDDVLNLLSRFHAGLGNEYIWAKRTTKMVEQKGETISASGAFTGASFQYADSVSYSNGQVVLNAPKSGTIPSTGSGGENGFNKYIICRQIVGSNKVVYVSSASGSGKTWYYDYKPVYFVKRPDSIVGYINSPNANAYPPSVDDGYTYEYMGQLGEKVRIATGSYVGTGNTTKLDLGVQAKLVFIAGFDNTNNYSAAIYIRNDKNTASGQIVPGVNESFMGVAMSHANHTYAAFVSNTNEIYITASGVTTNASRVTYVWYAFY